MKHLPHRGLPFKNRYNGLWFGTPVWWKCLLVTVAGVVPDYLLGPPAGGLLAPVLFPLKAILALEELREFILALSAGQASAGPETAETIGIALSTATSSPMALVASIMSFVLVTVVMAVIWPANSEEPQQD